MLEVVYKLMSYSGQGGWNSAKFPGYETSSAVTLFGDQSDNTMDCNIQFSGTDRKHFQATSNVTVFRVIGHR